VSGDRKKKFLITDANDKAGPKEGGGSHTGSPGEKNPGSAESPGHPTFQSHRSSLDIRQRLSGEREREREREKEGGEESGPLGKPPLPPNTTPRAESAMTLPVEHGSLGHGELLEGVGQTEVAPPLKGSQSLRDLTHPPLLQHQSSSGGMKQRFQIKDVPSPDSASSAPTEVQHSVVERASLDLSQMRQGNSRTHASPPLWHQQPTSQHRPPPSLVPVDGDAGGGTRRRSSCEKIREEQGEEGSGEEVENLDAAALRQLVRRLQKEMKQLRGEKTTLQQEKAQLQSLLHARPSAPIASGSGEGEGVPERPTPPNSSPLTHAPSQ